MANYKLTQTAKADLRQIYFYGFETWGEAAADQYYNPSVLKAYIDHHSRAMAV